MAKRTRVTKGKTDRQPAKILLNIDNQNKSRMDKHKTEWIRHKTALEKNHNPLPSFQSGDSSQT